MCVNVDMEIQDWRIVNFDFFLFQSSASAPDVDDPEAFPALA